MRDTLSIGPTPSGETCQQLGASYDPIRARQECAAFRNQLRRMFPDCPAGTGLVILANPHDFGVYLEVAVRYDDEDQDSQDYAYHIENNAPENWDAEALAELGIVAART